MEISQELDIDCLGSSYQFFAAATIEDYITRHCLSPLHIGELEFDPDTLEPISVTRGTGKLRLWRELDGRGFPLEPQVVLGCDDVGRHGGQQLGGQRHQPGEPGEDLGVRQSAHASGNLRSLHGGDSEVDGQRRMIWEQTGPGRQFGDSVIEAGYRHVYYRVDEEAVIKTMTRRARLGADPGQQTGAVGRVPACVRAANLHQSQRAVAAGFARSTSTSPTARWSIRAARTAWTPPEPGPTTATA